MITKSQLLLAWCVASAMAFSSAQAGKPDSHTEGYSDFVEIVDCGDFSVMDDAWVYQYIKHHYSKNGDLIRSSSRIRATSDLYRDDDPNGPHITGAVRLQARTFIDPDDNACHGGKDIDVPLTVPGYGPLFVHAGELEFGPDEEWHLSCLPDKCHHWSASDFEALCAFFDQN